MRKILFPTLISLGLIFSVLPKLLDSRGINLWSQQYVSEIDTCTHAPSLPDKHPRKSIWEAVWAIDCGEGQIALEYLDPVAINGEVFVLQLKAQALEQVGDFQTAIQFWKLADDAESLWKLALRSAEGGDWDAAFEAYKAAWKLRPEDGALPFGKFLLERERNYDYAEIVLRRALDTYPFSFHHSEWEYILADTLRAQTQALDAAEIYQQLIIEDPKDWKAHVELGEVFFQLYGMDAALVEFQKAIEMGARAEAYMAIGEVHMAEGRYSAADTWIQRAIELEPSHLGWNISRALLARKVGNSQLSIDILQDTIFNFPSYASAYYEISEDYRRSGQIDKAIAAINRALDFAPLKAEYHIRAGNIYENAQDLIRALAAYKQALVLDPYNKMVMDELEGLNSDK